MARSRTLTLFVLLSAAVLLVPASTLAQSNSDIAGVVKDTSGAVLPGVTVEAASPALIEKVRAVVTDGAGQYKIVGAAPGDLHGHVHAPRLQFGEARGHRADGVVHGDGQRRHAGRHGRGDDHRDRRDADGRSAERRAAAGDDAGHHQRGAGGDQVGDGARRAYSRRHDDQPGCRGTIYGSAAIAIHNSRAQEMQLLHDGMAYNNGQGRGGSFTAIATNDATVAEISLETSGLSAESEVSGIRSNVIPKDGGNTFKGYFFGTFTNDTMQSDNLSDDLKARGLLTVDRVNRIYDIDPALGGPIKKDVLWFYGSVRVWKTDQTIAGMFYNLNPPGIDQLHGRFEPAGVRRRLRRQPEPATHLAGLDQAQGHRPAAGQPADSRPFLRPGGGEPAAGARRDHVLQRAAVLSLAGGLERAADEPAAVEGGLSLAKKDFHYYPQPEVGDGPAIVDREHDRIRWGNIPNGGGFNASHNWNARLVALGT